MKKVLVLLGILMVIALGLIVLVASRMSRQQGVEIYAEEAVRRPIVQLVKATGRVNAKVEVNISSHLIGKIEKLYVQEGQLVRSGQPFLELEKDAFLALREDWATRLAMAKNEVAQGEIDLADAQLRLDRAERLTREGIMTREQLEAAQLARTSGQLRIERAAQAVLQAEANLQKAQDDLQKTTLYSPIDGLVVALEAKEGEVVVSGTMNNPASVLAVVADLSEVLAEVDVDENEIVKVRVGQEAELRVDAILDTVFRGRVVEVGTRGFNRAQQADVTFFRVKVLFETPDPRLRPGMSVRADIRTANRDEATVVPIQSVVQRPPLGSAPATSGITGVADEIPVVFVLTEGKALQKAVTTGLTDDTHVEVTGVEPGEKVITGPYRELKDLEDGKAARITTRKRRSSDDGGPRADDEEDEEER
ncbi:MAG TPA: efflux RND transporter periplasmic adaptor subunit [Thermoanaerobaculia bacterium]|nr:efflux RND transporter periplasmic adaptor subunit [Thermoanaerobaculia bacterium]